MKKTTLVFLILIVSTSVSAQFTEHNTFTTKNSNNALTLANTTDNVLYGGYSGRYYRITDTDLSYIDSYDYGDGYTEEIETNGNLIGLVERYGTHIIWENNNTERKYYPTSIGVHQTVAIDDKLIAIGGQESNIRLYNTTNLNHITNISTQGGVVSDIAINKEYIAYSDEDNNIVVHNRTDKSLIHSKTNLGMSSERIDLFNHSIAFSDGEKLLIYDIDSFTEKYSNNSHDGYIHAINVGGGYIFAGTSNGRVYAYNKNNYEFNASFGYGNIYNIYDIEITDNYVIYSDADYQISAWNYTPLTDGTTEPVVDPKANKHEAYINTSSNPDTYRILVNITNTSVDDVYLTDIYNYNKSKYIIGGDSGIPSNTLAETELLGYNYSSDSFVAGWKQKYRYNISLEDSDSGNISYYSDDFYIPNTAYWHYSMPVEFNGSDIKVYTFKTNEIDGFRWNYDDYHPNIPYDKYNISLDFSMYSNMSDSSTNIVGNGIIPVTKSGYIEYSFDKETIPEDFDNNTVYIKHNLRLYNSSTGDIKRKLSYKTRHDYTAEPTLTESVSSALAIWISKLIDSIDGFINSAVDTITDILNYISHTIIRIITTVINVITYVMSVIWAGIKYLFFLVFDHGQEVLFTAGNTTINWSNNATNTNVSFTEFITDGYVGNITYTSDEYWDDNNLSIIDSLEPVPLLSFIDTTDINKYSLDYVNSDNRYFNYSSTPKGGAGEGIENSGNCPSFGNVSLEATDVLFGGNVNYWSKCVENVNPRGIEQKHPDGLLENLYWFSTYRVGEIQLSERDTVTIKGELSAYEPTSDVGGKTGLIIYDTDNKSEHILYKTKAYCTGDNIQRHRVKMNLSENVKESGTFNVSWEADIDVKCDSYGKDQYYSGTFKLNTSKVKLGWYYDQLEDWTDLRVPLNAYETENAWDVESVTYASVNWYSLPELPDGYPLFFVGAVTFLNLIITFFADLIPAPMVEAVISFFDNIKTYIGAITSTLSSISGIFNTIFVTSFTATKEVLKWFGVYKIADWGIRLWDGFTDERESINTAVSGIIDEVTTYVEKTHNIAVNSFNVLNNVVQTVIRILHWLRELLPV